MLALPTNTFCILKELLTSKNYMLKIEENLYGPIEFIVNDINFESYI